jgi:hypothetical protein
MMSKQILRLIVGLIFAIGGNLWAYTAGDGSAENPYQISNVGDWQELMGTPGDWSSSFILTADIDLAGVEASSVGNDSSPFYGVFAGEGHKISNSVINQPGSNYVGLFGYIGLDGQISNLGVVDAVINGYFYTGGLVGYNNGGVVTGCYATGSVTGENYVGGLVGCNYGTLTSCYATSSVSIAGEYSYVGGLAGYNGDTINASYASGLVSSTSYDTGGLLGYNEGTVMDCFWDTQTSGRYYSGGGEGKTTEEMKMLSTFTNVNWDFSDTDGNPPVWQITENITYPRLFWETVVLPQYTGGLGTEIAPYQIAKVTDLQLLMASPADWGKYFIQTANIDMQGIAMTPIGTDPNNFTGSFDGQNYRISNIYIWMPSSSNIGFFGYIKSPANISNIQLKSGHVQGNSNVGGLIGRNDYGTVKNCCMTGSVTGSNNVGGLVGSNESTSLTDCYATGWVDGYMIVGGLVGINYSQLTTCYATGSVNGYQNIGGLAGHNYGALTSCYATGSVSGTGDNIGGLVGKNLYGSLMDCYATGEVTGSSSIKGGLIGYASGSTIINCFWDKDTSLQLTSAGGTGKTTMEMKMRATFTGAGWDFTDEIANGTNNYWRMCSDGADYPRFTWQKAAGDIICPAGVGLADFSVMAQNWLAGNCGASNQYCGSADLDMSGTVDMADFAIFAANWLAQ